MTADTPDTAGAASPASATSPADAPAGPFSSGPPDRPGDLADVPYEQARDELIDVVHRLEAGTASLAESMDLWRRGERLAAHCQSLLEAARTQVAATSSTPPTWADPHLGEE
jgi:exodeoxyribonuclease VII small subunit